MIVPIFARPENTIPFADQAAFVAFLEQHRMPLLEWGENKIRKLWKEVREGDAVYAMGDQIGLPPELPVRFILAVSLRVCMSHPERGMLVLIEFARKGNHYIARKHESSSLSEKILLHPDGSPAESPRETVIRCYETEVGIHLSRKEVGKDSLIFRPYVGTVGFMLPGSLYVEPNLKHDKGHKYFPLFTFAQVAHYIHYISHKHYWDGARRDVATKYYSFWRSVHESRSIDPIPLERLVERT